MPCGRSFADMHYCHLSSVMAVSRTRRDTCFSTCAKSKFLCVVNFGGFNATFLECLCLHNTLWGSRWCVCGVWQPQLVTNLISREVGCRVSSRREFTFLFCLHRNCVPLVTYTAKVTTSFSWVRYIHTGGSRHGCTC